MLREAEAASAWSGAKLREVEAASVWSGCRESATTACGPKTETSHTTEYEEIISVQTFKHSKLDPLMFRSVLVEDRSGTFTSATSIGLHCLHLRQRNRKETCTLTNIGYE